MGYKAKRNLNKAINAISEELNISEVVVQEVLLAYIRYIHTSIEKGKNILLDTVFSIKQYKTEEGNIILRGRVSEYIKDKVKDK
ncbi:hypothetical protein [Clostridioides sp. ZZV15-6597]|uniref:hypothetical protein n=1 Tax=Clostridioides sp. ZZV15-6597 TaxID=2811500 RepID=UPI001D0FBDA2|nr:hypothetical protein [Clostridioides sp. ZZV15-6597]